MTYYINRYILKENNKWGGVVMPETTIAAYRCERCGHVWAPRTSRRPIICPKCKSPYWDRPRLKQEDSK